MEAGHRLPAELSCNNTHSLCAFPPFIRRMIIRVVPPPECTFLLLHKVSRRSSSLYIFFGCLHHCQESFVGIKGETRGQVRAPLQCLHQPSNFLVVFFYSFQDWRSLMKSSETDRCLQPFFLLAILFLTSRNVEFQKKILSMYF